MRLEESMHFVTIRTRSLCNYLVTSIRLMLIALPLLYGCWSVQMLGAD